MQLDPARYGDYKTYTLKASRAVAEQLAVPFPQTVREVMDGTIGFLTARQYVRANPMVYSIEAEELSAHACWKCGPFLVPGIKHDSGFASNDYDKCVFNKSINGKQTTVCFHMDDLLITSESFTNMLLVNFPGLAINTGRNNSFLAKSIALRDDCVEIDMNGYIEKILEDWPDVACATSPGKSDLFKEVDSPLLARKEAEAFHSEVGRLLYLAKRARLDILTAVSYLASRV